MTTDYQIKKELENEIQKCEDNARPYAYIGRELLENAVDLIKRQRAEIAKLEEYIYRCKSGEEYWVKCLLERPNEAIREFAEEIKKRASKIFITNDQDGNEHITSYQFAPETIDDLVREMVGDTYEWHKKYDNQTDKGGTE